MTVLVADLSGKELQLEMEKQQTVADLKALLEQKWCVPKMMQSLSHNGQVIHDRTVLADICLTDGAPFSVLMVLSWEAPGKNAGITKKRATLAELRQFRNNELAIQAVVSLLESCPEMQAVGIEALSEMMPVGDECAATLLQRLSEAGFLPNAIRRAGFTIAQLTEAGHHHTQISSLQSIADWKEAGLIFPRYTSPQMLELGSVHF